MGIYTVNLTFAGNASYSNPNGGSFPIVGSYFAGTINVSAVAVPTTMQLLILPPVAVTPASAPRAGPAPTRGGPASAQRGAPFAACFGLQRLPQHLLLRPWWFLHVFTAPWPTCHAYECVSSGLDSPASAAH